MAQQPRVCLHVTGGLGDFTRIFVAMITWEWYTIGREGSNSESGIEISVTLAFFNRMLLNARQQ